MGISIRGKNEKSSPLITQLRTFFRDNENSIEMATKSSVESRSRAKQWPRRNYRTRMEREDAKDCKQCSSSALYLSSLIVRSMHNVQEINKYRGGHAFPCVRTHVTTRKPINGF